MNMERMLTIVYRLMACETCDYAKSASALEIGGPGSNHVLCNVGRVFANPEER
jgi:hypothetical protein